MSENNKNLVKIRDFDLFVSMVKSAAKIVAAAKFNIDTTGVSIYGANIEVKSRCELTSNSIWSDVPLSFSIQELNQFLKVLNTIQTIHEKDYSQLKFEISTPHIRFSSNKIKTKLNMIDEQKISKWVSKKITTQLTPIFEFTTTLDLIKRITSHSFIFGENQKDIRVYLDMNENMEKNAVYATLGNKENSLNNEITLKCGLVTFGSMVDKSIILDLQTLSLFSAFPCEQIKVSLMNMNVLASKTTLCGKNDSWFNISLYSALLKS